jgi:hypothetical protein
VDALLAAVDSIHPYPYGTHGRAEWVATAEELKRRLPSLRYHEAVLGFARLIALADDGHTRLGHVRLAEHERVALDLLPGEGFESLYPVQFEVFADGLHVVQAASHVGELAGRRVLAINGIPAAQVFERLSPYVAAGNDLWLLYVGATYLSSPGIVAGVGLTDAPTEALSLTLDAGGGRSTSVRVDPVPAGSEMEWVEAAAPIDEPDAPLYRRLQGNYGFRYLPESRTVYVRFRQVRDSESEPLDRFAERLFRFVDSAAVERLVFDVRRNGGGNNYLNQPLVHGLIRATAVNRPGALFVITDRGTFSAAISFVSDVERNTHALFVGEPTGGRVNHYGDSRRITLPVSGLEVRVSTLYWQQSDPRDRRAWVVPDIPVMLTIDDYVAGRDPVLAAALDYELPADYRALTPNRNWRRRSQVEGYTVRIDWGASASR